MRRAPLHTACLALVWALLSPGLLYCSTTVTASETDKLVLGTATKGGGFQLFGQHLLEVINANDTSLRLEELPTKGSAQNLPYLEEGKIDVGLVEGNAAQEAFDGVGRSPTALKVLAVMYPNPGMLAVRADSPYQHIEDLKGKPLAIGTRASGLRILGLDVLDGLGFKPEQDFELVVLDKAGDGPRLVLENKVEALWGAGIGWPGFVKIADSATGARFLAPSPEQIKQIQAKHPHLKTMSVPANTYKGQTTEIESVGLWSLVLVRPQLNDEVVYRLAKAIHQGQPALAKQLIQGRYTTAQNTVAQVPSTQLHPGAARFYREIGLLSP